MPSRIRQLASFDFYSKAQTDVKVVELSPPTDLSNYYTKVETDNSITGLDLSTMPSNEIKITAADGISNDMYGRSIAIGSNKIGVNSPYDDDSGSSSGSVYIYDLDGTNEIKITASDAAAGDSFGECAINDNRLLVGVAQNADDGLNSGSAYVYNLDGTNEIKITASDADIDDMFGSSVTIGSNKLIIGASNYYKATENGSVYIYDLDGTNEIKITASDAAGGDRFGNSVSTGNGKIIVGCPNNDDAGSNSGSVYIYDLDGTNEIKITASDAAAGDSFGWKVSTANGKIVVGAPYDEDNGYRSGAIYIYDLDGTNEIKITALDGETYDVFGGSLSIGSKRIFVQGNSHISSGNQNKVYIYNIDGSYIGTLTSSDAAADDKFGGSIAVSNDKLIISSIFDDDNGSNSGSVYIYDTPSNSLPYTNSQVDSKIADGLVDYYTKTQTDSNIVALSPPTDLSPYYNKIQVDSIINTLKGTASADFDTLGELEVGMDANELSVVTNAAAIVAAQNQIVTNHP